MDDMDSTRDELTPEIAAEKRSETPEAPLENGESLESAEKRLTRRALLSSALILAGGYGGLHWLNTRRTADGIVWPLRRALEASSEVGRDVFSPTRLAPQFPKSRITKPARVNGAYGLSIDQDLATWRLNVIGTPDGEPLSLTLKDIQKLPRQNIVTQFKCIEGWSMIVWWTGVRFSDFVKRYAPFKAGQMPPYVGAQTPDGEYYVSLDMESALHPQTLLAWEINGQPLSQEHGAPLRLVTPTKYGIKHLKRIGTLTFANERPPDYWAEQGYDWYAGH